MAGLGLDFLTRVVNVHWSDELAFLYSDATGMFGSSDGHRWKVAPSPVPAKSLAWVDGVWVGCGPEGIWRSTDGAKTWDTVGPGGKFLQVAAMKPEGLDAEGKPKQGVFAATGEDENGNGLVYSSRDGKNWIVSQTINATVGEEGGTEAITSLSGCGGAFFVGTVRSVNRFSQSEGWFYTSFDGFGFTGDMAFGPATVWDGNFPAPETTVGYGPGGVGYDPLTKTYLATIDKEIHPYGELQSMLAYAISASGSFSSEGNVVETAIVSGVAGDFISVYQSAAGGNGIFVGGSALRHFSAFGFLNAEVRAHVFPGGTAEPLASTIILGDEFIGSFCFKQLTKDDGVFACVAYGADKVGGVYTMDSPGGSFALAHSGIGFGNKEDNPSGAVAVGKLNFLGG